MLMATQVLIFHLKLNVWKAQLICCYNFEGGRVKVDNFSEIKKQMQRSEENLTSFACLSSDAIREKVKKKI